MKDFECAIFDLDGTILDSTDLWNKIDRDFFAERNLVLPDDYARKKVFTARLFTPLSDSGLKNPLTKFCKCGTAWRLSGLQTTLS